MNSEPRLCKTLVDHGRCKSCTDRFPSISAIVPAGSCVVVSHTGSGDAAPDDDGRLELTNQTPPGSRPPGLVGRDVMAYSICSVIEIAGFAVHRMANEDSGTGQPFQGTRCRVGLLTSHHPRQRRGEPPGCFARREDGEDPGMFLQRAPHGLLVPGHQISLLLWAGIHHDHNGAGSKTQHAARRAAGERAPHPLPERVPPASDQYAVHL